MIQIHEVPLETRKLFWSKVEKIPFHSCWEWTGARNAKGYGTFEFNGRGFRAHRVSYTMLVGPIPIGLTLDHLCRNRGCVNPDHLEAVSNRENILRGDGMAAKNARQTHCYRGHELTGGNIRMYRGQRICRLCRHDYKIARRLSST